jgi:phenylpropionate dioxygenase-like ring-hydroxylating dioxygenase large terminal subunit
MFALFEESGVFIASCRHRLVLLACDMIKSGELYVSFHQSYFCAD